MSFVIDSYCQDNLRILCEVDKNGLYTVYVGEILRDDFVHTIWVRDYGTKEQAKRSFHRQVAKAKKGEY